MKIKELKLEELKPYKLNAKDTPVEQIEKIANSIKEFGFTQPIVIDKNKEIIIGHGRAEASKLLGIDKVPCIVKEDLSDAEVKALRIVDNKLNESAWDLGLIESELDVLIEELGGDELLYDLGISFEDFDILGDLEDIEVDTSPKERQKLGDMNFTLSRKQIEVVKEALAIVGEVRDPFGINKNKNGNALFVICDFFIKN